MDSRSARISERLGCGNGRAPDRQAEVRPGLRLTTTGQSFRNTANIAWPDGEAKQPPIPAKYNSKTELTADVKSGKNTFDFPLESK